MIYRSASQHARDILSGKVSSLELTEAYLERIKKYNSSLNAIVISNAEEALDKAQEFDELMPNVSEPGPLFGVPITVKEAFNMKGLPTTVNFKPLKNYVATKDSIFVERLKRAGAIILGKTNIPVMLSDSQTFGPLYPTANNPYDLSRTPGGSTGGGAAAVAAGFATFELGSDIGGSIRNPSHYCGLFGLKPTQNGHAQAGHIPPLPGSKSGFTAMDSIGPLARTMDDIELAWDVIGKPRWDVLEMLPVHYPIENRDSVSKYKVAWFDTMGSFGSGNDSKKALEKLTSSLEANGCSVTRIELRPEFVEKVIEVWANLFGFISGQDASWLVRQIMKFQFAKMGKGLNNSMISHLKKGLNLNFKQFSRTLKKRQELWAEMHKIFNEYDFILSPASYGPAFQHNHKHNPIEIDGKTVSYVEYCFPFAMLYNALGNPSLVVPGYQTEEGLPVGVQIATSHYADAQLIHFGKLVEKLGFEFKAPDLERN